jgi:hypothetical protein
VVWLASRYVEREEHAMSRRYDDAVEVRRRDDVPAEFLWRGRLYSVRAVVAHWVEAGGWWRARAGSVDDREREVWRVEAAAGRAAGSGIYDLCFDWSAGGWTLARAHD